jgi:hypothetical protein
VSFAAITLCVASQRVIPKVSVYFLIESVRELLDTACTHNFDLQFICFMPANIELTVEKL